ncbi:MAG TPA: alpha/beta fold hydrolase, partial [Candidatus Binatus sp.]|nr:alpha/beta fold hydrolase [Candidatus Binatus sp.]
ISKTSSDSEEPPSRNSVAVDTHDFFLPGDGVSALVVHGLTGTPYEMRYLGDQLAARGVRVRGVKLAGHAGTPEELGAAGFDNWYESAINGLEELRQHGQPIVVIGLSMGAVLSARLAADQGESISGVVLLAPAFFLPTSTTLLLRTLRGVLGSFLDSIYLHNPGDSDIHDAAARSVHPTCHLMPLSAPLKLLDLSAMVRPMLPRVTQPTLVIHARRDHTCPMRKNLSHVLKHLGSVEKRAIELNDSYHVITVDSEKELVASEVAEFVERFRVAPQKRAAG